MEVMVMLKVNDYNFWSLEQSTPSGILPSQF
jgi:hypothetical protein